MKKYISQLLLIPVLACLASLSCYLAPERDNANDYANEGIPVPAIRYTFEDDSINMLDKIIHDVGNAGYHLDGSIDQSLINYFDESALQGQSKSISLFDENSSINIPDTPYPVDFDEGDFSIVIIAKNNGQDPWGALISKIGGTTSETLAGWCLRLDSAMHELILEAGETTMISPVASISTSGIFGIQSWHVIAATFDNTNAKWSVYLDDLSNTGNVSSYFPGSNSLTIGHSDTMNLEGQRSGFGGTMKFDAVMIYDYVLEAGQVEEIYNSL